MIELRVWTQTRLLGVLQNEPALQVTTIVIAPMVSFELPEIALVLAAMGLDTLTALLELPAII